MSAYSSLLNSLLMPAWYSTLGRAYVAHVRSLDKSQWWSEEQLRDFQWRELQPLLKTAFESCPLYQQKYSAVGAQLGDIRSLEDYARLPTLTRADIRERRSEITSRAYRGKIISHATGGSSGVPVRFGITIESFDWRCAATFRAYAMTGYVLGEKALYLWGSPVGSVSSKEQWKMKIFRTLRREFMVSTFNQSPALWQSVFDRARELRPPFMVGYVSSLEGFCRWLLETGNWLEGVQSVIAAAEPVHTAARDLVREAIGAPLYNTYGSREFMSIGAECEHRDGVHVNMENILIETEHPVATGPSPILVTDLHNFGMPFLRYEIGDVGQLSSEKCACGRGLHRLMRIDGRVLDVLRTPSGAIVPGEFFPHVLKEVPEVIEFQVEQKKIDHIVLSMVLSQELSSKSKALLDSEIRRWFGDSSILELKRVESIPLRPSGKRRVTIGLNDNGPGGGGAAA